MKNNKVTCLFFAGYFSPPCLAFTPLLINFYNEVNSEDKVLEIILVSYDKQKEDFNAFFKPIPFLALPFNDERIAYFTEHFNI